jgi:hypothetical protein
MRTGALYGCVAVAAVVVWSLQGDAMPGEVTDCSETYRTAFIPLYHTVLPAF